MFKVGTRIKFPKTGNVWEVVDTTSTMYKYILYLVQIDEKLSDGRKLGEISYDNLDGKGFVVVKTKVDHLPTWF